MNCILCLAGLFVEGAVGYVKPTPHPPAYAIAAHGIHAMWRFDANEAANPMGRIAIGHEWEADKVLVSLELRHESWLGTGKDHGQDSAWVSVRWRPFR